LHWEELYELHASGLIRFLAQLTGDPELAADLLQETFLSGIRDAHQLRDPGSVRAWLYSIATHLAAGQIRRAKLRRLLTGRLHVIPTSTIDETSASVRRALQAIPTEQAVTLVLHYDHGFSRRELAAMLEISEEGVKSRLARGRSRFLAAYRREQEVKP
jgi:RNA polymerase sigma-70 factor (ECF subfamily)